MQGDAIDSVTRLAALSALDLGDEAAAVADRYAQLVGFAREFDGLAADEVEIDATFDPSWGESR